MQRFVLLDLDGTLVDPGPGIIGAFRYALTELGHEPPAEEDLGWIIGPPLRQSFEKQLGSLTEVEAAIGLYRRHYGSGGLFDAKPYAGIKDALTALRADGYRLFLCTAKPLSFARKIVDHFGFSEYFDACYGADFEGTFDDKADLIRHILRQEGLDALSGCMVGDRSHDTKAAATNAMPSIGVLWGYGSREELTNSGATVLCDGPDRLKSVVDSLAQR